MNSLSFKFKIFSVIFSASFFFYLRQRFLYRQIFLDEYVLLDLKICHFFLFSSDILRWLRINIHFRPKIASLSVASQIGSDDFILDTKLVSCLLFHQLFRDDHASYAILAITLVHFISFYRCDVPRRSGLVSNLSGDTFIIVHTHWHQPFVRPLLVREVIFFHFQSHSCQF